MESEIIQNPKNNILICANAGSGKTKTLVDRVMGLLFSGCQPCKILCITYTKDAANVMLTRIFDRLNEIINDKEFIKYHIIAKNAILKIDEMQILTFHAFCFNELKNASIIPSSQNILDKEGDFTANSIISENIKKKAIDKLIANQNLLKIFIQEYSHYSFNVLISQVNQNISHFQLMKQNKEFYKKIYLEQIAKYDIKDAKYLFESIFSNKELLNLFNQMKDVKDIDNFLNSDSYFDKKTNFNRLLNIFFTKSFTIRADLKKKDQIYTQTANLLSNEINKAFQSHSAFLTVNFLDIIDIILQENENFKIQANVIEYHDIMNIFIQNLKSNDNFLANIYMKYNHLLIDEAQDLSGQQWEIVDILYNEYLQNYKDIEKSILIVGDQKQSIYSFNSANIQDFIQRIDKYQENAKKYSAPFHFINLPKSYRSCKEIIDFVNNFSFNKEIQPALFNKNKHEYIKTDKGLIKILDLKKENGIDEIVDKISQLDLQEQGETMVLFRSRKTALYEEFLNSMQEKNIPFSTNSGTNAYILRHIFLITSLLKIAANEINEYELIELLQTQSFNFSLDEISEIKEKYGAINIKIMMNYHKFTVIYQDLPYYHKNSNSILQFYNKISINKQISEIIYKNYSKNILNDVISYLYQLEQKTSFKILHHYIFDIEEISIPLKQNGVKVTTMHGCKGLEAENVFIVDKKINIHKYQKPSHNSEITFTTPDFKIFTLKSKTFRKYKEIVKNNNFISNIVQHNDDILLAEQKRLLYVSITRAKTNLSIYTEFEEGMHDLQNFVS